MRASANGNAAGAGRTQSTNHLKKAAQGIHLWLVLGMLAALSILHYSEQLGLPGIARSLSQLGITGRTVDRVLFLVPMTYASAVFGLRGGLAACFLALGIMLPRALLISPRTAEASIEVGGVVLTGVLACLWTESRLRRHETSREMETMQQDLAKQYRDIFDNASDAIWVHDLEGTILAANKATARLTGYNGEELIGMKAARFLSREGMDVARDIRARLLRGDSVTEPYDQRLIRRDGSDAYLKLTSSLLLSDGRPAGFQHIARDVTEERRMQENLRFYVQQVTRAQEEERKRIARELHDDTAQRLVALSHQLESFAGGNERLSAEDLRVLQNLRDQARAALQEVRHFSRDLRPSVLDDLGLLSALEWLTDGLERQFGINAELRVTGDQRRLSPEVEVLLFRIVQEAVNNARRHAGASEVHVTVEFLEGKTRATIRDNGKGFEVPRALGELSRTGKLGLVGMEERARLLGGSLTVQSAPGQGTTVTVEAPV